MSQFSDFLDKLLSHPSTRTIVVIDGTERTLRGLSKLTSVNYSKSIGVYYKAFFTDGSLLVIIPSLESISFAAQEIGQIPTVIDDEIGNVEIVEYNGKKYRLDNSHDYQYTLELIVGSLQDSEGECSFSDYSNTEDENDWLSLGWLSYNHQRADVNALSIDINRLIINN